MDRLSPYPEYKDSGVPWLGQIPAHWLPQRLKALVSNVNEQTSVKAADDLYIALENVESWTGQIRFLNHDSGFESQVKRFQENDVLFGRLRPYLAKVTRLSQRGVCVGEFFVLRPHTNHLLPSYLEHLLRSKPLIDVINSSTFGAKMPRVDWNFMSNLLVSQPPDVEEQDAIARYLDHADRQIRRFIRAKRRTIELLNEQKQVVTQNAINAANTRWQRLCFVADRVVRPIARKPDQVYVPIGLYNRGRGIFHKPPTDGSELGDSNFFWIAEGDLVISGQFAWEGAIALAGQEDDQCIASHRYPVLRGKQGIAESAYLLSFFRTSWGQLILDHHSRGAAGRNRPLNAESLMKEKVPLPPLSVQEEIVELVYLESCQRRAVAQEIALVQEYRTRLIADVVTGKIDVRAAAQHLPSQIDEAELWDEAISEDDEEIEEVEEASPDDD